METHKSDNEKARHAGFTIIELLIAMAIGSIVLMMLMQMIVMNVTARRKFEYQNFLTEQSLQITNYINQRLRDLQPQQMVIDDTSDPNAIIVTFVHEYDIGVNPDGSFNYTNNRIQDVLIYDKVNDQLTYNGTVIHSTKIVVLSATTMNVDLFDPTLDPLVCSDRTTPLCGDGVLTMDLELAVQFASGNIETSQIFESQIIV